MEQPREEKKLFPFRFPTEDELRLSVKQGLDQRFFYSVNRLNVDNMKEIVNKKYLIDQNQEMTLLIQATINGRDKIVGRLLEKCIDKIDIEAVGKVFCFDSLVDGATALWCAAGFGHLDIVKQLIEIGANVDGCTETKSTPLRAACFLGRVDIVEYLIEHGADVNVTNIFNSTCLMIAAYNGHSDVVKCLLENNADVNKQTLCGATAMHFAAQANNVNIIQLLLDSNAQQLKNEHSLTPILVAAERTHFMLVSVLRDILPLTLEEIIDAEELLGASYLNDKDNYNKEAGYCALLRAMELRFKKHPFCFKKPYKKVEAYNNQIECQSINDLENIKNNVGALHYESLIIRERILGENNPDLLQSIIYRGAVYADLHNFYPCVKLWIHALKISQYNKFNISKDIKRFTQVFCQMIKRNIKINLSDLKTVLQVVTEELKVNQAKLALTDPKSMPEEGGIKGEYFENISSTLGLIIITSMTLALDKGPKDPLTKDIMHSIVEINKLGLRTKYEQTLLHLCLDYDTNVDNIFTTGICCFPNYLSMKLLIYCGADVNAMDYEQSTPLHYIGKFILDFPHIPHDSKYLDTKNMVMELLNAGAHTDFVNKIGLCPHTGYLKTVFKITGKIPISLKCLSARTLKHKFPEEYYHNEIPQVLINFVHLH